MKVGPNPIPNPSQAVSYMLRTGQLAAAAALLQKQMGVHHRLQQPHGVARAALSLVVVGLASDDFDGAEAAHHAALERGDGYAGSDEAGVGGLVRVTVRVRVRVQG